jgi:hypothetical protein
MSRLADESSSVSPLERFVRDYVDAREGAWDEIEPQVYDVLLGTEMLRVAFDPEALPEHPSAQLASFGSPLVDRLLADAAGRWSSARLYRGGLNLHPHDLEGRLRKSIALPAPAALQVDRVRAMNFPQGVFWFKATFSSDQKEEEMVCVGIDLHYLREVRHIEALLGEDRAGIHLDREPVTILAEAKHAPLADGYAFARERAARTVGSLANARRREWAGRVEKQIARMSRYYAQLRSETEEQAARPRGGDVEAAASRAIARREAIDREEALRISELRQKSKVQVHLKLASVMVVMQPKLMISASVLTKDKPAMPLELVWDALSESVEAVPCPRCGQPTFSFQIDRGGVNCGKCPRGK